MMIRGGGDYQLFAIEKFEGKIRTGNNARSPKEVKKLEDALRKIKPREAFIIPKSWASLTHKIVQDLQLEIKITTMKIEGNDQHRRVIRVH